MFGLFASHSYCSAMERLGSRHIAASTRHLASVLFGETQLGVADPAYSTVQDEVYKSELCAYKPS